MSSTGHAGHGRNVLRQPLPFLYIILLTVNLMSRHSSLAFQQRHYSRSAFSSWNVIVSSPSDSSPSTPTSVISYLASDPFGDFGDEWDDDATRSQSRSPKFDAQTIRQRGNDASVATSSTTTSTPSNHFYSRKSLHDASFPQDQLFVKLCQAAGIDRPSKIQSLAWPTILKGRSSIVADQTGSGKTLAYLIPLLYRALQTNATTTNTTSKKANGAPRVLVLAPTSELADQIRAVCDKISSSLLLHKVKLGTRVVTATGQYSTSIREQIRMLQRQTLDVLISTPGRMATILRTRNHRLDLSQLQAIVLDEVDVLLDVENGKGDDTFRQQLRTISSSAPVDRTQFVFVTATLPDSIVDAVTREFPDGIQQMRGPGLHRVAPTVQEHLVDVSVPSRHNRDADFCFELKAKQLLKALRQTRCRRTLVFCNTVESCRQVENVLKRHDRKGQFYDVRAYHNALTPETRNQNLVAFARGGIQISASARGGTPPTSKHQRQQQQAVDSILVCTDRAARGVDFDASPVDHVIIFDFPKDPAEYVRRVGRTARAGRHGTSTVFAYGWQLPIAREVMGAKLDFSVAVPFRDSDTEDDNLSGKKQRNSKLSKDDSIKRNIEKGKLWGS